MKVYQISIRANTSNCLEHIGYDYFGSRKAAESQVKYKGDDFDCEIAEIEITPTKKNILRALNIYGGHANNG